MNLELLIFRFYEYTLDIAHSVNTGRLNMSPADLKTFVNYGDKLVSYNGKAKIRLYHNFFIFVDLSIKENYCRELRKELPDFEYLPQNTHGMHTCHYKKSNNITENLESNIELFFRNYDFDSN